MMILIGLDSDDWLDIDEYVFSMLGLRYMTSRIWVDCIFAWIFLFMPACYYSSWTSWFTWKNL